MNSKVRKLNFVNTELENRALEQILKAMESKRPLTFGDSMDKSADEQSMKTGWPPAKYKHIKGTGYGSSWRPGTYNIQAKTNDLEQSLTQTRPNRTHQLSNKNSRVSSQSPTVKKQQISFHIDEVTQNYISNLKSKSSSLYE